MHDGRGSNERFQRSDTFDPTDKPSRVVTSKARSWTVRTGRDSSAAGGGLVRYARDIDRPAPTLDTKVNRWTVLPGWPEMRPATTVQCAPRENGEAPLHEAIKITLEEAAILQGFPPDYPFLGSRTKQFEQVGNAIPPPLAAAILGALL